MTDFHSQLSKALRYSMDTVKNLTTQLESDQSTKEMRPDADTTLRGVLADALDDENRGVEAALLRDGHPVRVTNPFYVKSDTTEGQIVPNYSHFAWPGGYPLIYHSGSVVACPHCINQYAMDRAKDLAEGKTEGLATHPNTFKADVHYEGAPIECTECGREVESAYGDPDNPEE